MKRAGLRSIPSVEKLVQALGDAGLPRPTVVAVVRRELAALRKHGMRYPLSKMCFRAFVLRWKRWAHPEFNR